MRSLTFSRQRPKARLLSFRGYALLLAAAAIVAFWLFLAAGLVECALGRLG